MPAFELGPDARRQLLALARESIAHGLDQGEPLPLDPKAYPDALQCPGACFVTLELDGELRGCIGTLEARRPLVDAVAHYAYSAAFNDPRFEPLEAAELARVRIEISVLSPLEPLDVASEQELLARLRPGVDGLWLEQGRRNATFLPQVWEKLPEPAQFLRHLKHKGGWPADYWSETMRCSIYTVISVVEPHPPQADGAG